MQYMSILYEHIYTNHNVHFIAKFSLNMRLWEEITFVLMNLNLMFPLSRTTGLKVHQH